MRNQFAGNVIRRLQDGNPDAVANAIEWLQTNLTESAINGCHHCGEGRNAEAPCWWCGLRDKPQPRRRLQRVQEAV